MIAPKGSAGSAGLEVAFEDAWLLLCVRLQRDPETSEESDTCSLRAACKAMVAFAKANDLVEALQCARIVVASAQRTQGRELALEKIDAALSRAGKSS